MGTSFSYEEVTDYCKAYLGYPTVEVELDTTAYQRAVDDALTKLSYNRPIVKRKVFTATAGCVQYQLTDYGYAVIDVEREPQEVLMGAEVDLFNPMIMVHPLSLGDYELTRMYANEARRTLSSDFDWEFDKDTGKLLLNPPPSFTRQCVAVCLDKYDLTTIKDPWIQNWVKEYALGKAKQILGEIRRKIRSVEGSEITFELDGTELITEGRAECDRLIADLKEHSGDFVPPIRSSL